MFTAELLEPRIALSSIVTLTDGDGDSYTVKLKGPGTANITQDDLGSGDGPILSIALDATTNKSSLSVSVKKGPVGDGSVTIGEIHGTGGLKSLMAVNSQLIGTGLDLGGSANDKLKISVAAAADGANITTVSQLGSLTAQSIGDLTISTPAIGKLLTKAGSMLADLDVSGAVKSVNVKGGDAGGNWDAASFSKVTVKGGNLIAAIGAEGSGGKINITSKGGSGGNISGATIAAAELKFVKVTGDFRQSLLLAGANLGSDHAPGGSDSAADTFGPGTISRVSIGGVVEDSVIGAGLASMDGTLGNADDLLFMTAGLNASRIKALSVGGMAIPGAEELFVFAAAALPKNVKIGGTKVTPLSDARFFTVDATDKTAPIITGGLFNDTGILATDAVSMDAAFSGLVTDAGRIIRLRAGLDDAPPPSFSDVFGDLNPGGDFVLSSARLEQLNGGPLADGTHMLHVMAIDQGANAAVFDFAFNLDTTAPAVQLTQPLGGAMLAGGNRLVGTAGVTGSALQPLTYRIDGGSPIALPADALGVFNQPIDFNGLAAGPHTLEIAASDAAGNSGTTTLNFDYDPTLVRPFLLGGTAPIAGATEVGVTFKPQVFFSQPVNVATLNANNFFATFAGAKLPATIVPADDGSFAWLFFADPLPGSAQIEVTVDGATIVAGDGRLLDADRDGIPGGTFTFDFSTVSVAPVEGTRLTGVIADPGPDLLPGTADDGPLAGVEVSILGSNITTVTAADGRFTLDPTPVGDVKLVIDGRTAFDPPPTFYFPEMVMDVRTLPGTTNFVMAGMETMFLPRLKTSILHDVTNAAGVTIIANADGAPELTPEQRDRLRVEVQPGSLVGADGQPAATALIGISTVPPELVETMLPPGVLQHTFDITVQSMGATNFSTPAPMTFPNVFDAAPGTKLDFLSFDHTTGRLVIEGTATVSADGTFVSTDPGTGITHPGWHGLTPPGLCGGSGGAPVLPPPPPEPGDTVIEHAPMSLGMIFGENGPGISRTWQAPDTLPGTVRAAAAYAGLQHSATSAAGANAAAVPECHHRGGRPARDVFEKARRSRRRAGSCHPVLHASGWAKRNGCFRRRAEDLRRVVFRPREWFHGSHTRPALRFEDQDYGNQPDGRWESHLRHLHVLSLPLGGRDRRRTGGQQNRQHSGLPPHAHRWI